MPAVSGRIPEDAPLTGFPKRLRAFVEVSGTPERRAYACALLTTLRTERKRGNVWVPGRKRFGRLDDFFMPLAQWEPRRQAFFQRAGLPADPTAVGPWLRTRLQEASARFLTALPTNTAVTIDAKGWRLGTDPADELTAEEEIEVTAVHRWVRDQSPTIRLPDVLIAVDNALHWTRHFLPPARQTPGTAEEVCQVVATIMAHGGNLGPTTMAQLTHGGSADVIHRLPDWTLHVETLRAALADIVNAMLALDTTQVWGEGRTSRSDGQRLLFPRRVLRRTSSHRLGDFALEFYPFLAENSAPFYTVPIACTERDAPSVLDGLLSHESDLDPEEHSTDTHGYVARNFAAFPMLGKRFCPRIRGLHHQWISRLDPLHDSGALTPLVSPAKRQLPLEWSPDHWDRMGQCFASLAAGHTTASVALKRLLAYGPRKHFSRAVRELGLLFKTLCILDYRRDPALRRRVRRGLLKSEQRHA